MAVIRSFIPPGSAFGPQDIEILSIAYDLAMRELHDDGQPPIVEEVIAREIIALAAGGERDASKLCNAALTRFGLIKP